MKRDVYILRYYDWNMECGISCGVFPTMTDVLADIVDSYDGKVDVGKISEPKLDSFYGCPRTVINVDSEIGAELVVERWEYEETIADTIDQLKRDLKDCRNELCLRCGEYKRQHLGACDGCRWKEVG